MEVEPRQRNDTDKRPGYALLYVSSDAACVFLISLSSDFAARLRGGGAPSTLSCWSYPGVKETGCELSRYGRLSSC